MCKGHYVKKVFPDENAEYKKANACAKGVILMWTDNSFHHLLYEVKNGEENGHVGFTQEAFWYPRRGIRLVAVLITNQIQRDGWQQANAGSDQ